MSRDAHRPSLTALLIAVSSSVACGPLQTATGSSGTEPSDSVDDSDSTSRRDSGAAEDTAGATDSGDWAGGGAELNIESSDCGSGGDSATGNTVRITLVPGIVTVYPFTTNDEPTGGQITVVPTSSGLPQDGSSVRIWMSHRPGGPPVTEVGALKWALLDDVRTFWEAEASPELRSVWRLLVGIE